MLPVRVSPIRVPAGIAMGDTGWGSGTPSSTIVPSVVRSWTVTPLPATSERIWLTTWRTEPSATAPRRRTASVWAMSARALDVASAWRPRSTTNIVAPIASHSATASSAKEPTIRPVRLPGIGGSVGCRWRRDDLAHGRDQPVADAADGLDRWPVGAELPADLADMDVDRPGLAGEVRAPDVLEEHVAGQDDARIAGERRQEIELAGPEAEIATGNGRLAAAGIDAQRPDLHRPAAACRDVGPAEDRLDPGNERPRVERLRDVVVRAKLETDDRVDVIVPCR